MNFYIAHNFNAIPASPFDKSASWHGALRIITHFGVAMIKVFGV